MKHALLLAALCASVASARAGETLVVASRIHTMDAAQPQAESLVHDDAGKILAVGMRKELQVRYPQATVLDAGSATIIPGLIDAHGHLVGLGTNPYRQVSLYSSKSREETIARLQAFEKQLPKGVWLYGRGWRAKHWPQGGPTAAELDALIPGRGVWLERSDRRAGWASTSALNAMPASSAAAFVDGSRIERDAQGKATGIISGKAAMDRMLSLMPPIDDATLEKGLKEAMAKAAAVGLTGVHEAGISIAQLHMFQRLADKGELPIRITAWAEDEGASLDWLCKHGLYQHPSKRLKMRSVRFIVDGPLGNRTSALFDDYNDAPGEKGALWIAPQSLRTMMHKAKRCGVQVAAEALGDYGNRESLDAMAEVLGDAASSDHRWRIEHAQTLTPQDVPRFARLGVIASMQPVHATSDMAWVADRLGAQRTTLAYAWRTLRDAGARVPLSSDFPLESHDPRSGIHSAVTRTNVEHQPVGGWMPEQRLTLHEALRGYTTEAAFAGFAEGEVGSLAVGKRADFVILDADPYVWPADDLRTLPIRATYVDGKAVYQRAD